jgi:hypothetical protein
MSVRASGYGPSPHKPADVNNEDDAGDDVLSSTTSTPPKPGSLARIVTKSIALKGSNSMIRSYDAQGDEDDLTNKTISTYSLVRKISTMRLLNMPSSLSAPSPGVRNLEEFLRSAAAHDMPPFKLKEYGVEWHRDTVHLLTNALRREVMDLYAIIQSMYERRANLKSGDIQSLYVWFETFASFFAFVVSLIEFTFIPWLERSQELPEDSYLESEGGRMKVGKDIAKTVERVVKHKSKFVAMTPPSAHSKLHKVFKKWSPLFHGYIDSLDADAPGIIERCCSQDECANMTAWITRQAIESANKATNVVLLVRFLEDRPRTLTVWKNENLDPLERGAHPQHWKSVARDHFEVVAYFRRSTPSLAQNQK